MWIWCKTETDANVGFVWMEIWSQCQSAGAITVKIIVKLVCISTITVCQVGVYQYYHCMSSWCLSVLPLYVKLVCISTITVCQVGVYQYYHCMSSWCLSVLSLYVKLVCISTITVCQVGVYQYYHCMPIRCVSVVSLYVKLACISTITVCQVGGSRVNVTLVWISNSQNIILVLWLLWMLISFFLFFFFFFVLSHYDFSHGKFRLLFPGKVNCNRVMLPKPRCMLSVLVFPYST